MTKRRSRNTAAEGQDRDIGSRPVESTEHREASMDTAVRQPRAQAFWVALPLSIAVVVSLLSPIALGPRIFWLVTGICALAAFIWSVQFEMVWQDRATLPFLLGLVALCFWKFSDFAGWRVPESWQPFAALAATSALVFWWTFVAALWLTFIQRLGMPMFHQQYSIWTAIKDIWVWKVTKQAPEPVVDPPTRKVSFEVIESGGRVRHHISPPVDDDTFIAVADVLLSGATFSEANLSGTDKPLPGGQRGREMLDVLREWMLAEGVLRWNRTNGDGEPLKRQGVSLTARGSQWLQEALLPHPDEIERSRVETDAQTNERTKDER